MISVEIGINGDTKMRVSAVNVEPDCQAWPCKCKFKAHNYRCTVQFEDAKGNEKSYTFHVKHVRAEGMHRLALAMLREGAKWQNRE